MSKAAYVGVDGIARKVKKMYIGVDGVARKVKKAYIGVDGVARLFYSGSVWGGYTGNFTVSQVTGTDGVLYNLYTLTSTGTLTLTGPAQVWMCGGGGTGGEFNSSYGGSGRSGAGGGYVANSEITQGEYVVTVGAAGGASSIPNVCSANAGSNGGQYKGGNGGSGGGSSAKSTSSTQGPGTGAGKSTYPFGIESLRAHSAGGGAGSKNGTSGGKGGSNGASGELATSGATSGSISGGAGGSYGGGRGGSTTIQGSGVEYGSNGGAATFYGGGGGGAGGFKLSAQVSYSGGKGYQGVVYILEAA